MSKSNSKKKIEKEEAEETAVEEFTRVAGAFVDFMTDPETERRSPGEIRKVRNQCLTAIHGLKDLVIHELVDQGTPLDQAMGIVDRGLSACEKIARQSSSRIYTVQQGGTPEHVENLKQVIRQLFCQRRDELAAWQAEARKQKDFLLLLKNRDKDYAIREILDERIAALDVILLRVIHHDEDMI